MSGLERRVLVDMGLVCIETTKVTMFDYGASENLLPPFLRGMMKNLARIESPSGRVISTHA